MCEASSLTDLENLDNSKMESSHKRSHGHGDSIGTPKQNQVGTVMLFGVPIVSLVMDGKERLCLAQISSTLLKEFSYNEIHNRRVALGITCIQCTPVQLEILRRAGAMPVTSRRCGMITRREAERLCQSFLGDHAPPQLPENFAFEVYHECAWGCRGAFVPSRYNSSRAKCIRCSFCQLFFSPNKFIFHSHRLPDSRYVQPDAANFNSWRRHLKLCGDPPEEVSSSPTLYSKISPSKDDGNRSKESLVHNITSSVMATAQIVHAWEDVKAMFNGGTRKRLLAAHSIPSPQSRQRPPPSSSSGQKHSMSSAPNSSSSMNSNTNSSSVSSRAATPQISRQGQGQPFGHPCDLPSAIAASSASAFINSASPLLSPSPRIDAIWNPGISSAAAAAAAAAVAASRQCQMNANSSPTMPPLPFHPLSIPWLRRPLFPFSHPFGPTCKLFGENANGIIPPDTMGSSLVGNRPTSQNQMQNQNINMSAFKPVGRSAEQLFSWLNNNNIHNVAGMMHATTLPEDLSVGSSCPTDLHQDSNLTPVHPTKGGNLIYGNVNHALLLHQPTLIAHPDGTKEMLVNPSLSSSDSSSATNAHVIDTKKFISHSSQVMVSGEGRHPNVNNNHNGSNEDTEDEENVDIESTEADPEECSSTSNGCNVPNWMKNVNNNGNQSTLSTGNGNRGGKVKRAMIDRGEDDMDEDEPKRHVHLESHNFQRHVGSNKSHHGGGKKKRLWDCDRRIINIKTSSSTDQRLDTSRSSSSNSTTPDLLSLTD
ncbi:unnamed protein product [Allacma fusca]|uniref:c-SKI SMAD4-binding domain-containing protein n=1 Tax=Allacma fusca TaxID=39272 RepID=A0A8J2KNW9_9HEXA|nr:unnamed protein product [Allacma fusca]